MNKDVCLLTGGTGSIGAAMCRQFHADGYLIIANCHPTDLERSQATVDKLAEDGVQVSLKAFDVTDAADCARAVDEIEQEFGPIKVLVNAAGITRDATLLKLEPEQWNAVLSTNLDGVYNVTRPCLRYMTERNFGRIINISSVNGQRGQIGQTNYSAAKAGMTGFTKALAREVARKGITVNAVSPGYVQSAMIEAIPEDIQEKIVKTIPVGRFAQPTEIARAVGFLASPDSGYITGADLSVNGGFHMC